MHTAVSALLAISLALFAGFGLGFLFVPDPTGFGSLLVGLALTVVFAPLLYRSLRRRA